MKAAVFGTKTNELYPTGKLTKKLRYRCCKGRHGNNRNGRLGGRRIRDDARVHRQTSRIPTEGAFLQSDAGRVAALQDVAGVGRAEARAPVAVLEKGKRWWSGGLFAII